MKLNVKERVSIPVLCPLQGADILTQLVVKDILEKTALTRTEMEKIDYRGRKDGPGVQWDAEIKIPLKNVTFSTVELELLKSRVEKLNDEKKVSQDMLSLCLKIRDEKIKSKDEKRKPNRRRKK